MIFIIGVLFSFAAALSWGLNSHVMRIGIKDESPYFAMGIRAIFALPLLLLLLYAYEVEFLVQTYLSAFPLISGLVITVLIGDGLFLYGLKSYPVKVLLPIGTIYPLFTTAILLLLGEEILTIFIMIGTLTIIIGLYLVTSNGKLMLNTDSKAILIGVITTIGWGASVVFARLLLDINGINSIGLKVIRTSLLGIVGFIIYGIDNIKKSKEKNVKLNRTRSLLFIGLSGVIGWVMGATFLFLALESIDAAIATQISAINPIVAAVLGQLTGMEDINLYQFIGVIITTIGVIIILL